MKTTDLISANPPRLGARTTAAVAVVALFCLPHEISHYICLAFCSFEFLRTVWEKTQ
jgi:histone acetyltransferase (RNA polymerase elongator complex component)